MAKHPEVDAYVARSQLWPDELGALRDVLLGTELVEEYKWAKPCYTHKASNVVIVQEFKDGLALMFFKGALLADPSNVLEAPGPNSRSARRMRFTSVDDVARLSDAIATYVAEAIDVEDAGLEPGPAPDIVVDELEERFEREPALRAAFEALTPGRQREYHLYFADARRASTRAARIDRCAPKILSGKGFRDR